MKCIVGCIWESTESNFGDLGTRSNQLTPVGLADLRRQLDWSAFSCEEVI